MDYWLGSGGGEVTLTVHDGAGTQVAALSPSDRPGLNRVVWDLRHDPPQGSGEAGRGRSRFARGPLVVPGLYTVRLTVGRAISENVVRVTEDPRIRVDPQVRRQWTETLLDITSTLARTQALSREVSGAMARIVEGAADAPPDVRAKVRDLARELVELTSRLSNLRGNAEGWVGPLSADDASQQRFFASLVETLEAEWREARSGVR